MTEPKTLSRSLLQSGDLLTAVHKVHIGDEVVLYLAANTARETLHAERMIREDSTDGRVVLYQLASCLREPGGKRMYPEPDDAAMDELGRLLPGEWLDPLAYAIGAIAQGRDPQAAIDARLAGDEPKDDDQGE